MSVNLEIICDSCHGIVSDGDEICCSSCFYELKNKNEELEKEIEELKAVIDSLSIS